MFWFVAFLSVYFGGQAAADPDIGALIYIWFCIGGGIITILAWIFVKESKCYVFSESNSLGLDGLPFFLLSPP